MIAASPTRQFPSFTFFSPPMVQESPRFLTWLGLVLRVPAFSVTAGEVSTGDPVAGDLPRRSRVVLSQFCSSLSGFHPSEASTEVAGTFCCSRWGSHRSLSPATFPVTGKSLEFQFPSTDKVPTPSDTGTWCCASTFASSTSGLLPKICFTGEPECFLRSAPHIAATKSSRKVHEAVQELPFSKLMQMHRGKQRVVTEPSSVSTQVYPRRNSVGNTRNRVHENKESSSEGRVSVCANWPPDALFVRETNSPTLDEAKSSDPALFEAKICGQDFSNTSGGNSFNVIIDYTHAESIP
ncbi:hypothetical protein Cgig2_003446 [Carnegiea gigantea]|uniref:Uncharacterized protein n=1 Tax=Carnegiea gigantea TaxID=171969 RepID=A0A9Q1KC11_9CARY|nr:hypothetical protein Cgig2_003446 [Carnegiea gigantea]